MNSRNYGGNNNFRGAVSNASPAQKGKNILGSDSVPIIQNEWEVVGRKSKNQAPRNRGQPEKLPNQVRDTANDGGAGRGSRNNWVSNNSRNTRAPNQIGRRNNTNSLTAPLQNGWQWAGRVNNEDISGHDVDSDKALDDTISDEDELLEDSDEDLSDEYDSDMSQKSHETRKKHKLLKEFFETFDNLSSSELNDPTKRRHCPVCQKGPGAIDWYTGLQPLILHAKTKVGKRAQLHREFANILDEELRRRGSNVVTPGEAFGKWRGLCDTVKDHDILWPPMVVVMNTLLRKDDDDKWVGMGSPELLEYFSSYQAVRARHSYGPQGHRGMSMLIFESDAVGYLEAERLHKHFQEQGTDRDAWRRNPALFYPGGKRQLYGFLADKEDMVKFNQHSHGKTGIKYEVLSYKEMVVIPIKQMSMDNQQLLYFKYKVDREEKNSKTLEKSYQIMTQKLRETEDERRIMAFRTKMQCEENNEEMEYQTQFFSQQMAKLQKAVEEKEQELEKIREEVAKLQQSDRDSKSDKENRLKNEKIQMFIDSKVEGVEEFKAEREKLIEEHEEQKLKLKHKHKEEKVELERKHTEEEAEQEKAFDTALSKLVEKYALSS